jgi:glutathionylspermidine synthase
MELVEYIEQRPQWDQVVEKNVYSFKVHAEQIYYLLQKLTFM